MINNIITTKKINLGNPEERTQYSLKLQDFEKQFHYPLGNDQFTIQHGEKHSNHNLADNNLINTKKDYFSFFEKLGKPNVMVLEKNEKIIGVCSSVLREINDKKYWYLCDFKIEHEHRGQKLYRLLMWKYFLPCYVQSQNAFAINMSQPENNKLFSHMGKIFKAFNMKIEPNYLYSFTGKNLVQFPTEFWDNHLIVSNNGEKDIVIGNQSQKLFHIVSREHFQNNLERFTQFSSTAVADNDSVMFLSKQKMDYKFADESVISSFLKGKNFVSISSAEI